MIKIYFNLTFEEIEMKNFIMINDIIFKYFTCIKEIWIFNRLYSFEYIFRIK